jgi:hypothetical protein
MGLFGTSAKIKRKFQNLEEQEVHEVKNENRQNCGMIVKQIKIYFYFKEA